MGQEMTFELMEQQLPSFSEDPIGKKIIESFEKYKTLGMRKVLQRAREGAVAFVLSKMNLNLLIRSDAFEQTSYLNLVSFDGGRKQLVPIPGWEDRWKSKITREYDRPIPFDVLRDLPDDAGEKAYIFYPARRRDRGLDPILAYPMLPKERIHELFNAIEPVYERTFFGRLKIVDYKHKQPTDRISKYWAAAYQWE